jgi:ribosomal-protein-alanine N-acetyltransferase
MGVEVCTVVTVDHVGFHSDKDVGFSPRPLGGRAEALTCAHMMASSEPWVTLRRSPGQALRLIEDPSREVHVAIHESEIAGFVVLCMQGAFVAYVQSLCVRQDLRGRGVGTRLLAWAEERILRVVPNVFVCVSSFNRAAMRLYLRLGYEVVGELRDYIVRGHSEVLLRKSREPLSEV